MSSDVQHKRHSRAIAFLRDRLALPEVKNVNLDIPGTTILHAQIIQKKPFLRKIYFDLYTKIRRAIPGDLSRKIIVELGSGGGFLKEVIPNVITSDIIPLPNVDKHFDGLSMPFEDKSVDAFVMVDVFHHVSDSRTFLNEINRCLKVGGKIIMIEPCNTLWGRFIYQNFHHEVFDPNGYWGFPDSGPMSSANGAIPWIVFRRDKKKFEQEFPQLKLKAWRPHTPFRYLVSGGVSMKQLVPSRSYQFFQVLELLLSPLNGLLGTLVTIEVEKVA